MLLEDIMRETTIRGIVSDLKNGFYINDIPFRVSGIYVFFDKDNKALYVGETSDIRKRLNVQLRDAPFKDEIYRIEILRMKYSTTKKGMLFLESIFIDLYNPKYNKNNRKRSIFEDVLSISHFSVDGEKLIEEKLRER